MTRGQSPQNPRLPVNHLLAVVLCRGQARWRR